MKIFSSRRGHRSLALAATLGWLVAFPATGGADEAADKVSKIKLEATKLGASLHVLQAVGGFGGGNVAVLAGPDGILIVDTQLASMTAKLKAAIKGLSSQPVRFVVNSHPHADHIGGNAGIAPGAFIIAHPGTRTAMADPAEKLPAAALPRITVGERMSLYLNGEEVEIMHPRTGHTDSDLFVFFKNAKVAHLGDEYFAGMFPMIDDTGDLTGLIYNLEKLGAELPADYKIIPGHGKVVSLAELRETVKMLKETSAIVRTGIAAGKSLEQLKQDRVLASYDSWGKGYLTTDAYIAVLHAALTAKPRG